MKEVWKRVILKGIDYGDFYEVSSRGGLRNSKTKKNIKALVNPSGYVQYYASLGGRDKRKPFRIHRCVAEAFLPNPENKAQVNHIDGVKINNFVSNLEWVTASENVQHAFQTGLASNKAISGEKNPASKLKDEDVLYIRANYKPRCKTYGATALGIKYGVTHSIVSDIANNKRWTHI